MIILITLTLLISFINECDLISTYILYYYEQKDFILN